MPNCVIVLVCFFLFAVLASNLGVSALSKSHLILEPVSILPGRQTVLLFAPGAQVSPTAYRDLLLTTQDQAFSTKMLTLWVVALQFPNGNWFTNGQFDTAVSQALGDAFELVAEKAGVGAEMVDVFFAAHSRGAINLQDLIFKAEQYLLNGSPSTVALVVQGDNDVISNAASQANPLEIFRKVNNRGLVLFSAALQRKYRADRNGSYVSDGRYPIMTVGGDLDGLYRVFRLAESYYHDHMASYSSKDSNMRPVIVVPGANHMSMTNDDVGAPPFVAANDLQAEISRSEYRTKVAGLLAGFFSIHSTSSKSHHDTNRDLMRSIQSSTEFLMPIVQALLLEGSYGIKLPCNDLSANDKRDCWRGSQWSEMMGKAMTGLEDKVSLDVTDSFWKVYLINPVHLPNITSGRCPRPSKSCLLQLTSITQAVYPFLDRLDTGGTTISADELRVKFKSRQAAHVAAGLKRASFKELDDNDRVCKELNQKALDWAVKHAAPKTLARYRKLGAQLEMGPDLGPYNAGPNWIWMGLHFEKSNSTAENGRPRVIVKSPTMRTPVNYLVKAAAGFHYCKLLSPAKALEWIYRDSLKFQ